MVGEEKRKVTNNHLLVTFFALWEVDHWRKCERRPRKWDVTRTKEPGEHIRIYGLLFRRYAEYTVFSISSTISEIWLSFITKR